QRRLRLPKARSWALPADRPPLRDKPVGRAGRGRFAARPAGGRRRGLSALAGVDRKRRAHARDGRAAARHAGVLGFARTRRRLAGGLTMAALRSLLYMLFLVVTVIP